jgi:hypothetical protein
VKIVFECNDKEMLKIMVDSLGKYLKAAGRLSKQRFDELSEYNGLLWLEITKQKEILESILSRLDNELETGEGDVTKEDSNKAFSDTVNGPLKLYEQMVNFLKKQKYTEMHWVRVYSVKLINKVKPGDWLGERINATEGIPGNSVYGTPILPSKGKNYPLLYDRNTVYEIEQGNKVVLYSKIGGAVNYSNGKIMVSNYLEIDGDVDFKTGNINFDGYVSIKGTVTDGFSVEATKDIEINCDLGLGNVKSIKSHEGSIFIKGGIASKDTAEIYAGKNVFTRFLDNVRLSCGGIVHIGSKKALGYCTRNSKSIDRNTMLALRLQEFLSTTKR